MQMMGLPARFRRTPLALSLRSQTGRRCGKRGDIARNPIRLVSRTIRARHKRAQLQVLPAPPAAGFIPQSEEEDYVSQTFDHPCAVAAALSIAACGKKKKLPADAAAPAAAPAAAGDVVVKLGFAAR